MIEVEQLEFTYPRSEFRLVIDRLTIASGEKVAIVGPSGSGKTTLLNLISGISTPESGMISVDGNRVSAMNDGARRNFRISNIGMVFQQFDLVEYLNSLQNILLPYQINGSLNINADIREGAAELAASVGLGDKLRRFPNQLSQGEQQRVAICRALVNEPSLLLADEPTGNLDPASKKTVLEILFDQADRAGRTLVVVTHDMSILDGFDRSIDFEVFRQPVAAASSGASQ